MVVSSCRIWQSPSASFRFPPSVEQRLRYWKREPLAKEVEIGGEVGIQIIVDGTCFAIGVLMVEYPEFGLVELQPVAGEAFEEGVFQVEFDGKQECHKAGEGGKRERGYRSRSE